jgi:hypothetical protein
MAPDLFTYKFFDTTEGERELVGTVNAADIGEALLKAVSLLARQKISSRSRSSAPAGGTAMTSGTSAEPRNFLPRTSRCPPGPASGARLASVRPRKLTERYAAVLIAGLVRSIQRLPLNWDRK